MTTPSERDTIAKECLAIASEYGFSRDTWERIADLCLRHVADAVLAERTLCAQLLVEAQQKHYLSAAAIDFLRGRESELRARLPTSGEEKCTWYPSVMCWKPECPVCAKIPRERKGEAMREIPEIPALYDVAKKICHDLGMPWVDPRTGIRYPAPKTPRPRTRTTARRKKSRT